MERRQVIVKLSRLPFLLFAFANLLVGLFAGLSRLGWTWPGLSFPPQHGSIMVGGFLATLIMLEKALPLKKSYLMSFVIVNALSIVAIAFNYQRLSTTLLLVGSVGLIWIQAKYVCKYRTDFTLYLALLGAIFLAVGHLQLLSNQFYPRSIPWWFGFVLFTIVSERLELSKFLPVNASKKTILVMFLGLYVAGLLIPFHTIGRFVSATSLTLISIWLLRYDIISIGISKQGVTRFSSITLLLGYIALLFTGTFMFTANGLAFGYDIVVHCFFIGFTFSMIFAHGPIILPTILGLHVKPYHPILFVPVAALWLSLVIRVASDLFLLPYQYRLVSGWISAGSILLYFATLAVVALKQLKYQEFKT